MKILDTIIEQIISFYEFLRDRNIINTGIAFVIAIQINKIFLDFTNLIINPVASTIVSEEINQNKIKVGNINFEVGKLFLSIINFLIMMIFVYFVYTLENSAPGLVYNTIGKIRAFFGRKS